MTWPEELSDIFLAQQQTSFPAQPSIKAHRKGQALTLCLAMKPRQIFDNPSVSQ